ncbi:MAG: hypothetical protein WA990_16270 [Rubrobacteraceae bacterium]
MSVRRLALLPEEPAGLIPTRTPGAVRFEMKLTWRSPGEAGPERIFPEPPRGVRLYVDITNGGGDSGESGTRYISGEVRAFSERDLDDALDSLLGAGTSVAALSEAVLEFKTVRIARPRVLTPEAIGNLARGLWESGIGVRFGPCWTPLWEGVEAALGTGAGGIGNLEDGNGRVRGLASWETVSRPL